MFRLLDRRRILGGGLVIAGAVTIAGTLVLTGPATRVVRAAPTGIVFLVISMSDSAGGQYPTGSTVTVTALVSNSSVSGVGDATPVVALSFSTAALGFVANGSGWTCSTGTGGAGFESCTDGTITAGGSTSLLLTFTATGQPGNGATVTGTVSALGADVNSGSFSGNNTATHSASIANPAAYTKDVPPGSYPTKVGQDQIVATASQTNNFTFTDGSVTIGLGIPPAALPIGTHVSVYKANSTFWNSSLTSGGNGPFVDGYAAAWTTSGGVTGVNATGLVTMIVSDIVVTSTDSLFRATTSGVGTRTGVVGNGAWTVSFSEDPGFVLAQAAAAPSTSTTTTTTTALSSSASGITTVTPPTTGGGDATRGGTTTLPIGVGVLLFIGGTILLGTSRRRENG